MVGMVGGERGGCRSDVCVTFHGGMASMWIIEAIYQLVQVQHVVHEVLFCLKIALEELLGLRFLLGSELTCSHWRYIVRPPAS